MAETSLTARFGLDATGLKAGIKQIRGEVNSLVSQWGKWAAMAAAGAFVALSKQAIDLGSKLSDMAVQTGTNVESLQVLQSLARDAGVSIEQLNKVLVKARTSASDAAEGKKEYADAFKALNLNVKEFMALPQEKKLEAVGNGFRNATDKAAAYNAITTIFGDKAGPKMMEVLDTLATKGFDEVAKSAAKAGDVMSAETIAALDKAGDAIEAFKQRAVMAVGNIIVNFRSEEGIKLMIMQVRKVGEVFLAKLADAIYEGGAMIGAVFTGAFRGTMNFFQDGLVSVVQGIASLINKVLPERFEINVGNLDEFRSSGKGVAEEINDAIANTKPSTFRNDVEAVWDKLIADQKGVVDALNAVDFKPQADALRNAGKDIETSSNKGAAALATVPPAITKSGFEVAEAMVTSVKAAAAAAARELESRFTSIMRVGKGYSEQSDANLTGVRDRLRSQAQRASQTSAATGNYGDYLTASVLRGELAQVERELAERNKIRGVAARLGEDAARAQFGDTLTDRALRDMQADTERTAVAVENLNSRLRDLNLKLGVPTG